MNRLNLPQPRDDGRRREVGRLQSHKHHRERDPEESLEVDDGLGVFYLPKSQSLDGAPEALDRDQELCCKLVGEPLWHLSAPEVPNIQVVSVEQGVRKLVSEGELAPTWSGLRVHQDRKPHLIMREERARDRASQIAAKRSPIDGDARQIGERPEVTNWTFAETEEATGLFRLPPNIDFRPDALSQSEGRLSHPGRSFHRNQEVPIRIQKRQEPLDLELPESIQATSRVAEQEPLEVRSWTLLSYADQLIERHSIDRSQLLQLGWVRPSRPVLPVRDHGSRLIEQGGYLVLAEASTLPSPSQRWTQEKLFVRHGEHPLMIHSRQNGYQTVANTRSEVGR
jgi:hypothetical protein